MPDGGAQLYVDNSERTDPNVAVADALHRADLLYYASHHLSKGFPQYSVFRGLTTGQRSGLWALFGAALTFLTIAPVGLAAALAACGAGLFAVNIALRFIAAAWKASERDKKGHPTLDITHAELPTFTLLIPLYKEAEVAAQSVRAMSMLDYPRSNLQVIYLVEADDRQTTEALSAQRHVMDFEIVPLPDAQPRTKPRALNYGLGLAVGDIVTVYDAEDIPQPDQLRQAAARFIQGDADLAVVQAELSPHNDSDSWIAWQFTLEYDILFRVWNPFLAALKWPLALGGTSNHFNAAHLRAVGGWDPYNVTEDADLGFRLAAMGYKAAMISSRTLEEAPVTLRQWLPQRSRWIKGHLQTWMVVMRAPITRMRQIGVSAFLGLQFTFTLSLFASFLHGPLLIWTIWRCLNPDGLATLIYVGLLSCGYVSTAAAAYAGARPNGRLRTLLTTPLYWPLQSLAAMRALWEMQTCPHKWAKTQHGLSTPPGRFKEIDPS